MLAQKYIMKMDRRAKWITSITLVAAVGFFAFFYFTSSGSYLPAWFIILALAILALTALSIPRFISITQTSVEIHCVMDLKVIPKSNIKRVVAIPKKDMKWCLPIPIFGVWGIFGYYGYFFDFKNLKTFRLYASRWDDFILIEDIYEEFVIISSDKRDEIIDIISKNK